MTYHYYPIYFYDIQVITTKKATDLYFSDDKVLDLDLDRDKPVKSNCSSRV